MDRCVFFAVGSSQNRCVNFVFMRFYVRNCVRHVKSWNFKPVPGDHFYLTFRLCGPLGFSQYLTHG